MARTLSFVDQSDHVIRGKAVLEHHFNNHEHCGDWCCRKNQTPEEKAATKKLCRDKEKGTLPCNELKKRIERFVTFETLLEVSHGCQCRRIIQQCCCMASPQKQNTFKIRIAQEQNRRGSWHQWTESPWVL